MSLFNDNTKTGGYKHLNYTERTQIERWYNIDKKKPKEIAGLLNKSTRTIKREIKKGLVKNLNSDLTEKLVYSVNFKYYNILIYFLKKPCYNYFIK
ncbi:MAG: helix-turn-helix domain-containing protein [Proteiniphilum sp.]|nr:helix-turn-helix domain-containing protein [Proteiniphilum sp.]